MKIVLSTFGTRGDVQPMLALALGLKAAGHEALLIGPPGKAAWAAELGCPYQPLGNDITALMNTLNSIHSPYSSLAFRRFTRREVAVQFKELPDMVHNADIIVAASLSFGLASIAELLRIPYRYIIFTPQLMPSGHHPMPFFRYQRLPHWCNRVGWSLTKATRHFSVTRIVNDFRLKMGLSPIKDILKNILGPNVIVASDAAIAAVPPDIKTEYVQTGYMHLNQPEQLLPGLDEYLSVETPPVYVGFGSMVPRDQARLVPLIVSAARSAGRRVVISMCWREPNAKKYGDDVFFLHKCPHGQIFPKMAAIVHHGGAGTTATAALCGVPQVIVPYVWDQYYWGEQIRRSGLGPPPIWRSRLTAAKLGKAIQDCTEKQTYRQTARLMEQKIRRVNGVQRAIQAIFS